MNFKEFYLKEDGELSVGVVLFNDDKVLILKRGDSAPWEPGKWSLAGGMVEKGEELTTAILRELYEETKIKPDNLMYMAEYDNWHVFTAHTDYRQTDLEMENQQLDWITLDLVNNYEFVPNAKEAIIRAFTERS